MCACEPGYLCSKCRNTIDDPSYLIDEEDDQDRWFDHPLVAEVAE